MPLLTKAELAKLYALEPRDGTTLLVTLDTYWAIPMFKASAPGFGAYPAFDAETTIRDALTTWKHNGAPAFSGVWGAEGMREVSLAELVTAVDDYRAAQQRGS
jgi:hypothetical protein